MLKTFILGILLGLVAAAGVLFAFPAVDQTREASIVAVAPNGGNVETFHVNIPMDRIVLGGAGVDGTVPSGLHWPKDEILADVRAELYKIRNARDAVIGVAVRAVAAGDEGDVIDWVLHMPARGSIYIDMDLARRQDGMRIGDIVAGSREFSQLSGTMSERWVANDSDDEDAPIARIELKAVYVTKRVLSRELEVYE